MTLQTRVDVTTIVHLIRQKRARLTQIEREARELRSHLAAVRDSITQPRRSSLRAQGGRRIWPSSIAGRARTALQRAGRPMRADRLLRAINRLPGPKVSYATLVGQLAREVRRGNGVFMRTAPGEYILAEWRGRNPS